MAPASRRPAGAATRRRTPTGELPAALLLLPSEHGGHGYDLLARLGALGMEEVDGGASTAPCGAWSPTASSDRPWDGSERGPARRVYELTPAGRAHLARTIEAMSSRAELLRALVNRFSSAQAAR